jgi:hypothetical protein
MFSLLRFDHSARDTVFRGKVTPTLSRSRERGRYLAHKYRTEWRTTLAHFRGGQPAQISLHIEPAGHELVPHRIVDRNKLVSRLCRRSRITTSTTPMPRNRRCGSGYPHRLLTRPELKGTSPRRSAICVSRVALVNSVMLDFGTRHAAGLLFPARLNDVSVVEGRPLKVAAMKDVDISSLAVFFDCPGK